MDLTCVLARIAYPATRPRRGTLLKCLVDSGALYAVVPTPMLRRLGINPGKTKSFVVADGTETTRSRHEQ